MEQHLDGDVLSKDFCIYFYCLIFLVEKKVCFIPEAGDRGGTDTLVFKGWFSPLTNQWARAFIGRGSGLHAETARSALTVFLKLVIGGLINFILNVLSTANLQFQG